MTLHIRGHDDPVIRIRAYDERRLRFRVRMRPFLGSRCTQPLEYFLRVLLSSFDTRTVAPCAISCLSLSCHFALVCTRSADCVRELYARMFYWNDGTSDNGRVRMHASASVAHVC